MATKLSKPVAREIEFTDTIGNTGFVVVTMTSKGLSLRGKGKQREFNIPWGNLKSIIVPPVNMPAKYSSNAIGWLIEKSDKPEKPKTVSPVPKTETVETTPEVKTFIDTKIGEAE